MTLSIPDGYAFVSLEFSSMSDIGSVPTTTFGVNHDPGMDLANLFYTWWHDEYRPLQDPSVALARISTRDEVIEVGFDVNEYGTGSGEYEAPSSCVLVQKRSGLIGRQNRGRSFWPAILKETGTSQRGVLSSTFRTSVQEVADALTTALGLETANQVILHNDPSALPTAVTEYLVSGQVATQRRRNRR